MIQQQQQQQQHWVGLVYLLCTLWASLVEAEPDDAEVFAVQDQLAGIELELLIAAQHFLLPLHIVH